MPWSQPVDWEKDIIFSPPPPNERTKLILTALCIQSNFIKLPVNQIPIIQLIVFTHQLFPSKEPLLVDQRPDSLPELLKFVKQQLCNRTTLHNHLCLQSHSHSSDKNSAKAWLDNPEICSRSSCTQGTREKSSTHPSLTKDCFSAPLLSREEYSYVQETCCGMNRLLCRPERELYLNVLLHPYKFTKHKEGRGRKGILSKCYCPS